jgi:hypothetical protein
VANNEPTGIEIKAGVMKASPANPYFLIIFTKILERFEKRLLATICFCITGSFLLTTKSFILNQNEKTNLLKYILTNTPVNPAKKENRKDSQKLKPKNQKAAGTPKANLKQLKMKRGISFKSSENIIIYSCKFNGK